MARHLCPYCGRKDFDGPQGVKSHLSQYPPCRERMEREVADASRAQAMDTDIQPMPDLPPIEPQSPRVPESGGRQTPPTASQGPYITVYPRAAGRRLYRARTPFEALRETQLKRDLPPYAPFRSMDEWEHLRWLVTSGASQSKIDQYLKLNSVSPIGLFDVAEAHPSPDSRHGPSLPQQVQPPQVHRQAPAGPRLVLSYMVRRGEHHWQRRQALDGADRTLAAGSCRVYQGAA